MIRFGIKMPSTIKIYFGAGFNQKDEDNVFAGYRGKLKIGILPVSTFASGHTYFVTRMYEKVKQEPYVVHTFRGPARTESVTACAKALVWSDPPEYYDPPGGLLSYVRGDIPEDLLRHSGSVEGHFAGKSSTPASSRRARVRAET